MARKKQSSTDETKSASLAGGQDDEHKNDATANEEAAAAKKPITKKKATQKKKAASRKNSDTKRSAPPELNSEVATIAAILMSDRVREIRLLEVIPRELSDPSWDLEFDGALKRAELLIRKLTSRDFDVHLYQVFPEGQKFTEKQISDELGRVKWKNLTAKATIRDLMVDLEKLFEEFLEPKEEYLPDPPEKIDQAIKTLRASLLDIWERSSATCAFNPDYLNAELILYQQLRNELLHRLGDGIKREKNLRIRFIRWCFPFEKRGGSQIRRYRPHELFRFAAARDFCPDKLVITLSDLAPGFVPYPQKDLDWRCFRAFEHSLASDLGV